MKGKYAIMKYLKLSGGFHAILKDLSVAVRMSESNKNIGEHQL